MTKFTIVCVVLFSIIYLSQNEGFFLSRADEINIRTETTKYKKIIASTKNYKDISAYLDSYITNLQKILSILNKEFIKDEKLNILVERYGIFKNHKVILQRNKNQLIYKFGNYLDENGIKIGYGEGNIFLYFDPIYVFKELNGVLPKNIIEYFILESIDIDEGFEEDAGLIIPWDMIRRKIIRYDMYLDKISNIDCLYIIKATKEKIYTYLNAYFKGLPNSGIDECIKEAKSSYEKYLEENRNSKYYEIVKKYYHELERNGFKFSYKNYVKNGHAYETAIIVDIHNKEMSINEVADKYLNEIKERFLNSEVE